MKGSTRPGKWQVHLSRESPAGAKPFSPREHICFTDMVMRNHFPLWQQSLIMTLSRLASGSWLRHGAW